VGSTADSLQSSSDAHVAPLGVSCACVTRADARIPMRSMVGEVALTAETGGDAPGGRACTAVIGQAARLGVRRFLTSG